MSFVRASFACATTPFFSGATGGGISGQFSFAQAAFYGMGGYAAAIVGAHTPLSPYWSLLLAPLVGYGAGYGLGRVASRHNLISVGRSGTKDGSSAAMATRYQHVLDSILQGVAGQVGGLLWDIPRPAGE